MPSVMQRIGTPNPRHNLDNAYRAHLENVDPELSQYNVTLRERSVESIYDEHLQPAFEKFNKKQKRKDRRLDVKYGVDTYLGYQRALDKAAQESDNELAKKGRPPIREIVWQYGNPEQGYGSKDQTPESRVKIMGMLVEAQKEAERRYPQLLWGDLVFHADEISTDANDEEHGSLHLHASFVPICKQNKQGTEVQVAFERCLKEMGFATFEAWKHDLDNIMEEVLERHGLQREVMGNDNEHQDSKAFHRQQKLIAETKRLEKERDAAKKAAEVAETQRREAEDKLTKTSEDLTEVKEQLSAAEAQLQEEYDRHEEMQKINEESLEVIERNEKLIEDLNEELQLIQTYEEYCTEAADVHKDIDMVEALTAEIPEAAKLMKASASERWADRMLQMLQKLRKLISAGIQRLRIFERTHAGEVREPLSTSAEKRAQALDKMIDAAAGRAGQAGADRPQVRSDERGF